MGHKYFSDLQKLKEIEEELRKLEEKGCNRDAKCFRQWLLVKNALQREVDKIYWSLAYRWAAVPELRKEIDEIVKHAIELGVDEMTWERWERMKETEEKYIRYVLSPDARMFAKLMKSPDVHELLAGVTEGLAMRKNSEFEAKVIAETLRRLMEDPKTRELLEAAMKEAAEKVAKEGVEDKTKESGQR